MPSEEIAEVFDEVNTDQTEINGQQVIDEKEFLAFYNNLLEREVLHIIFDQVIYSPLSSSIFSSILNIGNFYILYKILSGRRTNNFITKHLKFRPISLNVIF